jgi:hypothetical protein
MKNRTILAIITSVMLSAVSVRADSPSFITHQGAKQDWACANSTSGMLPHQSYTVASDNAGNGTSGSSWDYSGSGYITVYNPSKSGALLGVELAYGDQSVCGDGPNDCYWRSGIAYYTIPQGYFPVPFQFMVPNQSASAEMAFYVTLTPYSHLQCISQTYSTTEHDGDNY